MTRVRSPVDHEFKNRCRTRVVAAGSVYRTVSGNPGVIGHQEAGRFSDADYLSGQRPFNIHKVVSRWGRHPFAVYSERIGKVNSIRRRNTICDRRRHGCALVQDVLE